MQLQFSCNLSYATGLIFSCMCRLQLKTSCIRQLQNGKFLVVYVPFLPTSFNGDVTFELSPLLTNIHSSSQMQGMDRKYNGHVWCKVIATNIKNSFGLNFMKACCLGHLLCVKDDHENFVRLGFQNEIF
jgi:hypothetical protein